MGENTTRMSLFLFFFFLFFDATDESERVRAFESGRRPGRRLMAAVWGDEKRSTCRLSADTTGLLSVD